MDVKPALANWLNPNIDLNVKRAELTGTSNSKPLSLVNICIHSVPGISFFCTNTIGVKLSQLVNLIAVGLLFVRAAKTVKDIIEVVVIQGENILLERTNRMLTSLAKSISNMVVLYTCITLNLPSFLHSMDLIWFHLPFINQATFISTQRFHLWLGFILYGLFNAVDLIFRITVKVMYPTFSVYPDMLIFNISNYTIIQVCLCKICLICFIQVITIFVSTGFKEIAKQLEDVNFEPSDKGMPKLSPFFIYHGTAWLANHRKSFELLNEMVNLTNKKFHLFIYSAIICIIPASITIIYDIIFAEMELKIYHVIDITFNIIFIEILIYYLSLFNLHSHRIWLALYRLTLISKNEMTTLEATLFMNRISNLPVGVQLSDKFVITLGVGPSLVAVIITVFVSITSLNQVFLNNANATNNN
uniref:Uncharacterized protein n=1 Tax=Tetranychus urticae TaxID=32264 RepID=T1KWA2_TETUR